MLAATIPPPIAATNRFLRSATWQFKQSLCRTFAVDIRGSRSRRFEAQLNAISAQVTVRFPKGFFMLRMDNAQVRQHAPLAGPRHQPTKAFVSIP